MSRVNLENANQPKQSKKTGQKRGDKEQPSAINSRNRKNGNKVPYNPFLLIRSSTTDSGARPLTRPPLLFWRSPDIWTESSDPNGRTVPDEDYYISVRIYNRGLADAIPVQVDFYSFFAYPLYRPAPEACHLIGTAWAQIRAGTSEVIRCPTALRRSGMSNWIPWGIWETVIVNCSAPVLDPILHPFRADLDRHVGRRNIWMDVPGMRWIWPM
jgi:hypothetical protein